MQFRPTRIADLPGAPRRRALPGADAARIGVLRVTLETVTAIRALHEEGVSRAAIARRYRISPSSVSNIAHGRRGASSGFDRIAALELRVETLERLLRARVGAVGTIGPEYDGVWDIVCSECGAGVDHPCTGTGGRVKVLPHPERVDARKENHNAS